MENLNPEIIAAIVAILGAVASYIKSRADINGIRDERASTAQARDQDSQELHDAVQKNTWDISNIKNENGHRQQVIEQLQAQINALNTTLATTNTKLDVLVEAIKELKGSKRRSRG